MAAWRDDFVSGGKEGRSSPVVTTLTEIHPGLLTEIHQSAAGRAPSEEDRRRKDAKRKVGEVMMENEILRVAIPKTGLQTRAPPSRRPL